MAWRHNRLEASSGDTYVVRSGMSFRADFTPDGTFVGSTGTRRRTRVPVR